MLLALAVKFVKAFGARPNINTMRRNTSDKSL